MEHHEWSKPTGPEVPGVVSGAPGPLGTLAAMGPLQPVHISIPCSMWGRESNLPPAAFYSDPIINFFPSEIEEFL